MHFEHERDVLKLEMERVHLTNNDVFFPELVWEPVLRKIKNPVDIESCSNASLYFLKLLETKRQSNVVAPRLFQQLSCYFSEHDNDNDSTVENDETLMENFYKLRQVCKSWNAIIEHLHQSPEAGHFQMPGDVKTFKNIHLRLYAEDVFFPEKLPQQFLHHFDPTHYDAVGRKPKKNPFLGRSVQFNYIVLGNHEQDEDTMYMNGIIEMLEKYGAEIWYAWFDFWDIHGTNLVEIYNRFVQFLKLMPNLKGLTVDCERQDFDENANLDMDYIRSVHLRQLKREIGRNPIPKSPNLEYLWTTDLPTRFFNQLLQKNSHISKLQVDRKKRHSDYSIFKCQLPNLTDLGVMFCSVKDFEKFENCRISVQVEKFHVWYNGPPNLLGWSRLFHALERQIGETCSELLIQLPLPKTEYQSIRTFDETHFGRLNLPNLQNIEIRDEIALSLDFLLPAKQSLRKFSIKYFAVQEDGFLLKRFAEYEDKQLIKFIGFKERMEYSNIWEEFPILEILTLSRKREMGGCIRYTAKRNVKGSFILEKDRWYRETD